MYLLKKIHSDSKKRGNIQNVPSIYVVVDKEIESNNNCR